MMKKTVFLKNAAILTVSSLLLRFVGILFKVWLAAAVGSEGIGLYQLVFSVYVLASTFAASGISTAVTRLAADELALGTAKGVSRILRRCIELTLLIAMISTLVVWYGADLIAARLLSDVRAAPALRILSLSLPFMGVCSCLRGYFIARRRASPTAVSQLLEQAVRIGLVVMLVRRFLSRGLAFTTGAVLLGDTAAEIVSAGLLGLLYLRDRRAVRGLSGRKPPRGTVRAVLHIAVPITAGRYLNTALRTAENILVPKKLSEYGGGRSALSQFGMIKGMALPILFFPATLLSSLSLLLIPEMSEAAARGQKAVVRSAAQQVLRLTGLLSFLIGAVFFTGGKQLGALIYHSDDVGFLLCALAPIVPLMYLDSVSDGILKGLDQQAFSFRTGVCDSVLRIGLILALLPRFGMTGFLGVMYVSNLLTCTLNVGRLMKITGARLDPAGDLLLPLAGALSVTLFARAALNGLGALPDAVYLLLLCGFSLPCYAGLLLACGSIRRDELSPLKKASGRGNS